MEGITVTRDDVRTFQELARQFSNKSVARLFGREGADGDMAIVPELIETAFSIGLASSPDPASAGHEYGIWGTMTDEAGAAPSVQMLEEVAETCGGTAMCLHMQGVAANILTTSACRMPRTPVRAALCLQEGPYPPPCASLRGPLGKLAYMTAASPEGNGYRITGLKEYVYAMDGIDTYVVFADLSGTWACFAVPADAPGLSVSGAGWRTGLRACNLSTIALEGVYVPANARIDGGDAQALARRALALSWTGMAGIAAGIARGAVNAARHYAAERYQGGAMIDQHPVIKMYAGDSESKTEMVMASLAALEPADCASLPMLKKAAELKLTATRTASEVVSDSLQVFGGYGYMEDFGMEKRLRDVTVLKSAWGAPFFLKQFINDLERED